MLHRSCCTAVVPVLYIPFAPGYLPSRRSVMPGSNNRRQAEPDDHACTKPLEDEDGGTY